VPAPAVPDDADEPPLAVVRPGTAPEFPPFVAEAARRVPPVPLPEIQAAAFPPLAEEVEEPLPGTIGMYADMPAKPVDPAETAAEELAEPAVDPEAFPPAAEKPPEAPPADDAAVCPPEPAPPPYAVTYEPNDVFPP